MSDEVGFDDLFETISLVFGFEGDWGDGDLTYFSSSFNNFYSWFFYRII